MAIDLKPGKTIKVKITRLINRAGARKTLERLFMQDKSIVKPINIRSANFVEIPKRRGGCIWTKRTNKVHPNLGCGAQATLKTTPQSVRDLNSVLEFIEIA